MYVLKTINNDVLMYFSRFNEFYECCFTPDFDLAMEFDTRDTSLTYSRVIKNHYGIDCEVVKVEE